MKKDFETQEIKKAGDFDYLKTSDLRKDMLGFIGANERKHLLLFNLIEISDIRESELFESLLLKLFDNIKDEMLMSDFFSKSDLADVNSLLYFVKLHISHLRLDNVDLSHDRGHNFLNLLGM